MNYLYENLVEHRGCHNPEEVLTNLNPNTLGEFLQNMGFTEQDAKTLLIKTLNYVEDHKEEFDT